MAEENEPTIFSQEQKAREEMGVVGLSMFSGLISEAYKTDLEWPTCWDIYERIRRSAPEMAIARLMMSTLSRAVDFEWHTPKEATSADEEFADFLTSVIADVDFEKWRDTCVAQIPFHGWGAWEFVAGVRRPGWTAPDSGEPFHTFNDDGMIGIRKLGWRSQSTFSKWLTDERNRVTGMQQRSLRTAETIDLPKEKLLHIRFGDFHNPEGLSPLEAVYRLERIKYGLELIQGIGFEHTAGYVKFKVKEKLDEDTKALIKKAARAIMSAQEGNYMTEITEEFEADMMDISFQSAPAILEAIKHYHLLQLQVYNMQWVAIASTADTGSYSAMKDGSEMYLSTFNAMWDGFAKQAGRQIAEFIRRANPGSFEDITAYPTLKPTSIEKEIDLEKLGGFAKRIYEMMPLGEDDLKAIRQRSGLLPLDLPDEEDVVTTPPEPTLPGEFIRRPFSVAPEEDPKDLFRDFSEQPTEDDIEHARRRFDRFIKEHWPDLDGLLDAEPVEDESEIEEA